MTVKKQLQGYSCFRLGETRVLTTTSANISKSEDKGQSSATFLLPAVEQLRKDSERDGTTFLFFSSGRSILWNLCFLWSCFFHINSVCALDLNTACNWKGMQIRYSGETICLHNLSTILMKSTVKMRECNHLASYCYFYIQWNVFYLAVSVLSWLYWILRFGLYFIWIFDTWHKVWGVINMIFKHVLIISWCNWGL